MFFSNHSDASGQCCSPAHHQLLNLGILWFRPLHISLFPDTHQPQILFLSILFCPSVWAMQANSWCSLLLQYILSDFDWYKIVLSISVSCCNGYLLWLCPSSLHLSIFFHFYHKECVSPLCSSPFFCLLCDVSFLITSLLLKDEQC